MDGGRRDRDRAGHDAPRHRTLSAPCQTRSSTPTARSPSAMRLDATRSAACRSEKVAGHAPTSSIRVPACASRVQRWSVVQPAPSAGLRRLAVGETAPRTAPALPPSIPNSTSASPIAVAP